MELRPIGSTCAACGSIGIATMRYCDAICERVGSRYLDVRTGMDGSRPHLHVTCGRCGYEWLTETQEAQ